MISRFRRIYRISKGLEPQFIDAEVFYYLSWIQQLNLRWQIQKLSQYEDSPHISAQNSHQGDEEELEQLRQAIKLESSQMFSLISDQNAFIDKITQYNNSAVGELRNGRFQESLVYLNEAENILECAASCGRNISRSFIISVLQNSACAYLHTWEVDKASIYIEAILFNLVGEGSKDETPVTESEKRIYQSEGLVMSAQFLHQLKAPVIHLYYSAIKSQLGDHDSAIDSVMKALQYYKTSCASLYKFQLSARGLGNSDNSENGPKVMLRDLSSVRETIDCGQYQKYLKIALRVLKKIKVREDNKFREDRLIQDIKNLDIREIMQVQPSQIEKTSGNLYGPSSTLENSLLAQVSYIQKLKRAIQISACYFVIATEMRMKNSNHFLPHYDNEDKKSHACYHLAAIILTGRYIPYETKFLNHLVVSFHKNYQINLMDVCEEIDLNQKQTQNNIFMDIIEIDPKIQKTLKKEISSKKNLKSPTPNLLKASSIQSKMESSTNVDSVKMKKPKLPLLNSKLRKKDSKKDQSKIGIYGQTQRRRNRIKQGQKTKRQEGRKSKSEGKGKLVGVSINSEKNRDNSPVGTQKFLVLPDSKSNVSKNKGNRSQSQKKSMSKSKSKINKCKQKKKNHLHNEYFQKPTPTPTNKKSTGRNFFGPAN